MFGWEQSGRTTFFCYTGNHLRIDLPQCLTVFCFVLFFKYFLVNKRFAYPTLICSNLLKDSSPRKNKKVKRALWPLPPFSWRQTLILEGQARLWQDMGGQSTEPGDSAPIPCPASFKTWGEFLDLSSCHLQNRDNATQQKKLLTNTVQEKMSRVSEDQVRGQPVELHGGRDLLRSRTLPKRPWSRSSVLQFQRCWRNWCWHSAVHSATPRPMARITSGCRWHSCRWRLTRPGTLSHITLEEPPVALMYLKRTKMEVKHHEGLGLVPCSPGN